jgi:hypothetical protein
MGVAYFLGWAQLVLTVSFLLAESVFRRIVSFCIELLPRTWVQQCVLERLFLVPDPLDHL